MNFHSIKIKDLKSKIGAQVKSMRKKEGLTQEALAELLGLSRITIQNLEAGKNFTIDTLLKVLQHFGLLEKLHTEIEAQENENIDSLY